MTDAVGDHRWIGVVGEPDGEREVLVEALRRWSDPEVFDHVDGALSQGTGEASGKVADGRRLLLLTRRVQPTELFRAAAEEAARGSIVAQARVVPEDADGRADGTVVSDPGPVGGPGSGEEGRIRVRPISLGYEESLPDFLRRWEGEAPGPVLELRRVLGALGRIRHDINNPLTAALAEVQLLLMDIADQEARQSLEVVQDQLRRIRDLVRDLAGFRPPDR